MRVLCCINHYFGKNAAFVGKSSLSVNTSKQVYEEIAAKRKTIVGKCIEALQKIPGAEVKVCGITGKTLITPDLVFDNISSRPLHMVYESLNYMAQFVEEYDYFINIEDDILLPLDTFQETVEFDKLSLVNEVLHPNRLEKSDSGDEYCVDLKALMGYSNQRKHYNGFELRVGINPHSGILILSKHKLKYALSQLDLNFRGVLYYNELDSAYAYFHSPFALFRSVDLRFHKVYHLDRWSYSKGEALHQGNGFLSRVAFSDFVPPIVLRLHRKYFKR